MVVTPARNGPASRSFVDSFGLWTPEQHAAAERVRRMVEEREVHTVRVSFPDLAGLPRGKSFMKDSFLRAFTNGVEILSAPLLLGSADERVYDSFAAQPPLGIAQLAGSANMVVVPDPLTFQLLPWAPGTAWMIGDCYFPDGQPCPLASRTLMRRALDVMHEAGFAYKVGLEVEFYIFKIDDPRLRPEELGQGPGHPADPPSVTAIAHGYKYLCEHRLDEVDGLLRVLRGNLTEMGLPLRNIDDEWGPGQVEFVFDPLSGLAGADTMFLFRTAVKQICRRMGYLATFMCQPRIQACCPSGWHLHQSLTDLASGQNAFRPAVDEDRLSEVGRYFAGGLLRHARASSIFATPTVTGYRRRRPFSLAPDRATWGIDHRGAMVRLWGTADPGACHLENRIGEPAANPYLYMASQIYAGLDGINGKVDPGPPSKDPYRDTSRPLLPKSLAEAIEALKVDDFYASKLGHSFVQHVVSMKEAEFARYEQAARRYEQAARRSDAGPAESDGVSEWEEREYFELL